MFSQEIFNIDLFQFLRGLTLYSKSVRISFFFSDSQAREKNIRRNEKVACHASSLNPCRRFFLVPTCSILVARLFLGGGTSGCSKSNIEKLANIRKISSIFHHNS